MKYSFKIINGRKHLVTDDNSFPLLNTFLLSEGVNFDDIIEEAITEFEEKGISYFSGNLFSLDLENQRVVLYNKFTDDENIIPANLFVEIFRKWNK